jgi:hypothetical protein
MEMVSMNKKIKNSGWLRGYGEHLQSYLYWNYCYFISV